MTSPHPNAASRPRNRLSALGPGLLFAAAAIGVSHLVQSTRAGAGWGLALIPLVLLANLLKYPAFRFGPEYAAITRTSLLEGYRRQGTWALVVVALVTLATMFFVQAAVTVVTAGLAMALMPGGLLIHFLAGVLAAEGVFFAVTTRKVIQGSVAVAMGGALELVTIGAGFELGVVEVSATLMVQCGVLLWLGEYHWLDRITRVLVAVLTVGTLAATIAVIPDAVACGSGLWGPPEWDVPTIAFVAALVGWMPSAVDVAAWQSLWTLARSDDDGEDRDPGDVRFDFHVGYIGTALLAVCFVLLGAGVMYGKGVEPAGGAAGFAAQVISLFTETLGAWAGPVLGASALAVMFSTTLTVLDGFPRAISVLIDRFSSSETPGGHVQSSPLVRRHYWISVVVLGVGATLLLKIALTQLPVFVDIATTASFLTAPVLAWLNHRAMHDESVPLHERPRPWLRALSWVSIVFLGAFAAYYVALQLI